MSLKFKFIPLTFLKDENQIKKQIKNTVILKHFYTLNSNAIKLEKLIEGTQYGYNASAKEIGANKFLRISDITEGNVDWPNVPFCDCDNQSTYLLNEEDLLIARTGGTTGKSFLIKNPPKNAIYAGYLIRIRANERSNSEYLNLFLNSYVYWSQVVSLNKGEFRPSVNASKLKELVLPNLNHKQQADAVNISQGNIPEGYNNLKLKIEKVLTDYENCKNLQSTIDSQKNKVHLLKQSILQEAIQGKLTADWRKENPKFITGENSAEKLLEKIKTEKAQLVKEKKFKKEKALPPINEDEFPFDLPEGWIWCRLGDLINISSGDGLTSKQMVPGKIPVFGGNGINGCHNKYNISSKTITIGRVGAYCGAVHLTPKFAWITDNCFRVYYSSKYLDREFLIWHLKYLDLGRSSYNGSQPVISGKRVYPILTYLTSLEEQKKIVLKIKILMDKCDVLEQEIKESEQNAEILMQTVLKEAFDPKVQEIIVEA